MELNKAIVCLTRGYSDLSKYNQLILRNTAIFNHINSELKYPLYIFHEGNITEQAQNHIKHNSHGQSITFINISDSWSGGYEGMCKFHIHDLWQYCNKLNIDYTLRIDEDCIIQKVVYNPFDQLVNRPDHVYLTSVYWAESHSETNATLPNFIKEITGAQNLDFYNDKFPYTNVGLTDVRYMMKIKHYTNLVAQSPLQRANRWGDLPVLGSLFNLFSAKLGTLEGLSYYHASHNVSIDC